jgi:hypothetical protein
LESVFLAATHGNSAASHPDGNGNVHPYTDCYGHVYSNAHGNRLIHTYANPNRDAYRYT